MPVAVLPPRSGLRQCGFTLLELLVVLVVIGLGSALGISAVDRLAGRTEESRWYDRTVQEVHRLRQQAVLGQRLVQAELSFSRGDLRRVDLVPPRVLLTLPARYSFEPVLGVSGLPDPSQQDRVSLLFFPDGSLSDTRFAVVGPQGQALQIHLAGLSGKIEQVHRGR